MARASLEQELELGVLTPGSITNPLWGACGALLVPSAVTLFSEVKTFIGATISSRNNDLKKN